MPSVRSVIKLCRSSIKMSKCRHGRKSKNLTEMHLYIQSNHIVLTKWMVIATQWRAVVVLRSELRVQKQIPVEMQQWASSKMGRLCIENCNSRMGSTLILNTFTTISGVRIQNKVRLAIKNCIITNLISDTQSIKQIEEIGAIKQASLSIIPRMWTASIRFSLNVL